MRTTLVETSAPSYVEPRKLVHKQVNTKWHISQSEKKTTPRDVLDPPHTHTQTSLFLGTIHEIQLFSEWNSKNKSNENKNF